VISVDSLAEPPNYILPECYGADLGRFFTKIGLRKSIFLEIVRAPIIISHVAMFIPFHISRHIMKIPFTSYASPIISSTTADRNAFRSHVGNALQIWQLQSLVVAIGEGSLRKLSEPVRHTPVAGGRAMQRRMVIRV
jgi:hypothetical protein